MKGVIFTHTLRTNLLSAVYWGAGVGSVGLLFLLILPNVEVLEQFTRLLEAMPPALLQAFGAADAAQFGTPEGFLSFSYFNYMMLILSAYGVTAGLSVMTAEEDRGILDSLLSAPVSRVQLMLEKAFAYLVLMLVLLLVSFLGFVIGTATSTLPLDLSKLLVGTLNMLPPMLTVFGFTVFAGALMRGRPAALALGVAFVVGSYFINFIGGAASQTAVAVLRVVSYFTYYGGETILTSGVEWGGVGILIAAGVILFAGGAFLFQRRDIGL